MNATPSVPAVSFSHIGFYVKDIVAMEDFFRRVMGFVVTDRGKLGSVVRVSNVGRSSGSDRERSTARWRVDRLLTVAECDFAYPYLT